MMTVYQFLHLAVLLCNTSDFIAPCVDEVVRCGEEHYNGIGLGIGYHLSVRKCFTLKQNNNLPIDKVLNSTTKKKEHKI